MPVLIALAFLIALAGETTTAEGQVVSEHTDPRARMGSVGFVTDDLDATLAFYTAVLDFTVAGRAEVTAAKTKQVIGLASETAPLRYAALAPADWVDGDKSLALISFFESAVAPRPASAGDPIRPAGSLARPQERPSLLPHRIVPFG